MELSLLMLFLVVLSGFIKGFVGFGLSLILITVLLQLGFAPAELLPILVPLFVILDILLYIENRKHATYNFKENFPLHPTTLMTLFVGILIGTYLLLTIDGSHLKLLFAMVVLILLFFLIEKVNLHHMRIPKEEENGLFGVLAGIMTGLFTINAVPTTLYLLYHQYPKEKYMGTLVTFLLISDFLLVSIYLFSGLFTYAGFLVSFELFFLVLIGFALGSYIRRFLPGSKFKGFVILILALNSLKIIYDYFFGM